LARETRARIAVQHEPACLSNTQASLPEALPLRASQQRGMKGFEGQQRYGSKRRCGKSKTRREV
jgi:hypothetical protein